jgi:hypothetical protein
MFKGSTEVARAFAEGKSKKRKHDQSTGEALYYHGNKIAEWRKKTLYVSNGGYAGSKGETGSKTTKDKLNALPNVNVVQKNFKWYLNGVEWNGEWKKVAGVHAPKIDKSKSGDVFVTQMKYVKTDGWRGYEEPEFAVAGVNDTGMWSDSPCPSNDATVELTAIKELLAKEKIEVKEVVCQTSNVFCVHRYLIPKLKNVEKAREMVKNYIDNNETELLYHVS